MIGLRRFTIGVTTFCLVVGVGMAVHDLPGLMMLYTSPQEAEAAARRVRVGMSPAEVADVLGTSGRRHPTKFPFFCVLIRPGPGSDTGSAQRLVERASREAGYYQQYRFPERSVDVHFAGYPDPTAASVEVSPAPPFEWGWLVPWLVAGGLLGYRAMGFGARRPNGPTPAPDEPRPE